jgi:HAD superfamily hydrolase (TIGR01549 family)
MTLDTPINAVYTALDWIGLDATMIVVLERMNSLKLHKSKANLPLISGARQALESLSQKYPMAIVSARGEKGTQEFFEYHNLEDLFVCIASGQTTPHTKPWPDPILWCAEKMGVPPESCLMIGDTTVDIRAGLAAGCQTAGVLSGFGDEKELSRAGANILLDSVGQLEEALISKN